MTERVENSEGNRLAVGVIPPGRFEHSTLADRRKGMDRIAGAGLDHVFFADHVSFRGGFGKDGMIQAAALAHCHETLGIYLGIYLLALRHPVTVARQLSTLCEMAPGRILFGVGVGGEDRHEIEVCGVDPKTRGRRTDECLEIVQGLLRGEPLDFEGEFFQLEQAQILPTPSPKVPVFIGGRSEAALRRTARYGDGWLSVWKSPEAFAEGTAFVESAAREIGRRHTFHHGLQVWCGIDDDPRRARQYVSSRMEEFYKVPFERFERYSPFGPPSAVAEFLRPYRDAGCRTFNIAMCAGSEPAGIEGVAEVKRLLAS